MGGLPLSTKDKKKGIKHFISWFEIPALDFDQAVGFYNHIFGIEMQCHVNAENSMAFFPAHNGVGGAVITGPGSVPSDTGPLIYLNAGDDLSLVLNKVEEAGGRVIMPKTFIDEDSGYFGIFIDSQGNKLALHSNS